MDLVQRRGFGSSFIAAHLRQIARQYDDRRGHLGKHSEKSHPIPVFHRHSAEPQIITQSQAPEFVIPLLFEMCVWRSPDRKTGYHRPNWWETGS